MKEDLKKAAKVGDTALESENNQFGYMVDGEIIQNVKCSCNH